MGALGSFEHWRAHLHEQHFDKLGGTYGPEDIVPCYWCCRPCVTKRGQSRASNRLPKKGIQANAGYNGYNGYAPSEVDSIDFRSRGAVEEQHTQSLEDASPPGMRGGRRAL